MDEAQVLRSLKALVEQYAVVERQPNPRWSIEQLHRETEKHYREFYQRAAMMVRNHEGSEP